MAGGEVEEAKARQGTATASKLEDEVELKMEGCRLRFVAAVLEPRRACGVRTENNSTPQAWE